MTDEPSRHLLNAHYEIVRLAQVMRNVNFHNFAAGLDAIERDLRAVIGDEAANANLNRKKPVFRRAAERRGYGRRRFTSRRENQS